jgi:predicted MPP superfamily phosphohydrolase
MGNWERRGHLLPDDARIAYEKAGVRFLCNESATLKVGAARLGIVGLDDAVAGRPDVDGALADGGESDATIWLMHAPGYADLLPAAVRASVVLAGHTHGGQIRLPPIPAFTPSGSGRFVAGWYSTAVAPLYVSRGIGTTGIRARLNCAPELPVLTLKSGARS